MYLIKKITFKYYTFLFFLKKILTLNTYFRYNIFNVSQ